MKVEFWMTGKTTHSYLKEPIKIFTKRIKAYLPFELKELKIARQKTESQIKNAESELILKQLTSNDYLVLLDEKGKEFSSKSFAKYFQNMMNQSYGKIVFLAGGAYGFSEAIYTRSNSTIALSQMTFTHEMVRIIFLEQLYRGLTILNNHPYHN